MFKLLKSGNAFDNGLMIAYILAFIFLLVSCQTNTYTKQEVEELKQEYESQLENAREDSYQDGYDDGYDDGYSVGWDDSALEYGDNFSDAPTSQSSHVVWVTPAGSKYHLRSCSAIRGHSVERTTIAKAEAAGYTACSKCDP